MASSSSKTRVKRENLSASTRSWRRKPKRLLHKTNGIQAKDRTEFLRSVRSFFIVRNFFSIQFSVSSLNRSWRGRNSNFFKTSAQTTSPIFHNIVHKEPCCFSTRFPQNPDKIRAKPKVFS